MAHMKHETHSSVRHTKVCGSERGLQSGEQGSGNAAVHMSSHRELNTEKELKTDMEMQPPHVRKSLGFCFAGVLHSPRTGGPCPKVSQRDPSICL